MMRTFRLKCLLLAALLAAALCAAPVATAADTSIITRGRGSLPVDLQGPVGFPEAVRLALTRSDSLRSTQLDIESVKLSEKDAWYRLFPKLILLANYDVPLTSGHDSAGRSYKSTTSVSFSTGNYDPISAYIGHDASKLAVKLAEVRHIIAIQREMAQIAQAFIALRASDEIIDCRRKMAAEMEALQKYVVQRFNGGSLTTLEYKAAHQRANLARLELTRAERQQALLRMNLKRMLGVAESEALRFDTAKLDEVLAVEAGTGSGSPEETLRRQPELRAHALLEQLQVYNIRLAQAEHIPKFSFGLSTPDPMSNQGGSLPYYATMQASVPLWSWGETMRGVERAELKLQGLKAEGRALLAKTRQAIGDLRLEADTAEEAANIAAAKTEVQKLEVLRKEISHGAGNAPYDALNAAREAALKSALEEVLARQARDTARLNLKTATGQLLYEHIQVNYGELEKY